MSHNAFEYRMSNCWLA